jgi:hypothetical protein
MSEKFTKKKNRYLLERIVVSFDNDINKAREADSRKSN